MSSEHGEMPAALVGILSRGNRPRSSEHGEMPAALDPLCAEVRHGARRNARCSPASPARCRLHRACPLRPAAATALFVPFRCRVARS